MHAVAEGKRRQALDLGHLRLGRLLVDLLVNLLADTGLTRSNPRLAAVYMRSLAHLLSVFLPIVAHQRWERTMFERIIDFFWAEPERFETWGRGLISASCAWLITGTVTTAAVFIVRTASHSSGVSLETLFPGLPAWLLPESVGGTLPALLPLFIGYKLNRIGALYKAQY